MKYQPYFQTKYISSIEVVSDLLAYYSQRGGSAPDSDKDWMRTMIQSLFLDMFSNAKNLHRVLSRLALTHEDDEDFVKECNQWLSVLSSMEADYATL